MADMDKIVNSRWYIFFNWVVRLIFLSIIGVLTPLVAGGVFMLPWLFLDAANLFYIILAIIGLVVLVWIGIPSACATYATLAIWNDGGDANTFTTYYRFLFSDLKELWRYELVMIPVVAILAGAIYCYLVLMKNEGAWFVIGAIGFGVTALLSWFVLLAGVHLPPAVNSFRMKTKDLIRFTFMMAVRMAPQSFLWFFILYGMAALSLVNSMLTPLWFIIGYALSMYFVVLLSKNRYAYLVARTTVKSSDKAPAETTEEDRKDDNDTKEDKS